MTVLDFCVNGEKMLLNELKIQEYEKHWQIQDIKNKWHKTKSTENYFLVLLKLEYVWVDIGKDR